MVGLLRQNPRHEADLERGGHDVEHGGGEDEVDAARPPVDYAVQRPRLPRQMIPVYGFRV